MGCFDLVIAAVGEGRGVVVVGAVEQVNADVDEIFRTTVFDIDR
jgi:hypothetical protein